jgi:hypothetical protein
MSEYIATVEWTIVRHCQPVRTEIRVESPRDES